MAFASRATTNQDWGASDSTADHVFFLGDPVPPTTPEEFALLERLIARSTDPFGFDRQALLGLDGVAEAEAPE